MNKKFLENIKPVKPEYSDILGEVGDFKTKEGYSHSKLIYAKITKLEELSEGHRYGKINTVKVEMRNGNIEIFAEKINNTNGGNFDAIQTLEKHRRLKGIGAKTLDQMFIAKGGKVIISTLLNKDKRVAVSANDNLSSFSKGEKINYQEVFNKNLKIKNLEEVLKSLLEQTTLASQVGLELTHDCLFFLIPENHNDKPVSIDFSIGDLDIVKINDFRKNNLAHLSLGEIRNNIIFFIKKYTDNSSEYKPEYLKLIQKILNPKLKNNQILTKNGVKDLVDYIKEDGEVLKSKLEDPDENTSWKEIEKLSQVSSAAIDLTNIKIKFKEKITSWRGALIDKSLEFNYSTLQTVGGSLDVRSAKSFSVKNLTEIQNIYLRFSNFSEYCQDDTFDWDKAYKDNRLVLKKELREKVKWWLE